MWPFHSHVTVGESGLLEGLVDYHCHLLPGVDDGVQKLEHTLSILDMWEQQHVSEIWLTPHIMEDIPNKTTDLRNAFDDLKKHYSGRIVLHLSAENMMDNTLSERLPKGDILPLGKEQRHLLVETSYFNPPYDMDATLESVFSKGYYPVLAHPERYNYMKMDDYKRLKDRRVLFQLNIPSLVGAYGKEVQQKAEALLEKGFYDLYCTDTHSVRFVKFFLSGKMSKKVFRQTRQLIEHHSL